MPLIENTPSFFSPHGCCAYDYGPTNEELAIDASIANMDIIRNAAEGIICAAAVAKEAKRAIVAKLHELRHNHDAQGPIIDLDQCFNALQDTKDNIIRALREIDEE